MTARPDTTSAEAIYTPEEAAAYLKLNKVTVYRFIREGKLRARRIGDRRYRITQADLDDFLSRVTVETTDREESNDPS